MATQSTTPPRPGGSRFGGIRLDPTCIDLTEFDLVQGLRDLRSSSETIAARANALAKDVTYITVGLGVLSFQRAQVRRRELERALRR